MYVGNKGPWSIDRIVRSNDNFPEMKGFLIYSLFLTFFVSCSLEYDTSVQDELSETIPSSVLYNVEQVQVKEGSPRAFFSAEEAKVWDERDDTELFHVKFQEFDRARRIITDGEADYILINGNNDATISGNISGYSLNNEASLKAETLNWKDETRELESPGDEDVTISLDGGTVLEGAGFAADFYTNTVVFSTHVSGNIEAGAEKDE